MSERNRTEKKMSGKRFLAVCCILFAVLCAFLLGPLFLSGKSLVWTTDGRPQYYAYLYYMGNTLRDFFSGLVHGRFSLPLYDFCIGLGDDAGAVMRLHLLDLLSVFVPGRYTELLYDVLTVLRLFLAGLAFSAYGKHRGWKPFYVLTGAGLYLSCGYVIKVGIANPTFLSAMILLPLLLLCADKILQGERCLLFIVVTALGFINNYYFMYQCSIALAVYVLLRLPAALEGEEKGERAGTGAKRVLLMILYYLCGAAISMVFFLPVLLRLFESARLTDAYSGSLLAYGGSWITNTIADLFAPYLNPGNNAHLNFAAPALAAAVLAFTKKKSGKDLLALRGSLVIEAAALLVPAAGLLMNGMGGVSNRWTYMIAFSLACALAACGSEWESPRILQIAVTGALTAGYAVICALTAPEGEKKTFLVMAVILMVICLVWMIVMALVSKKGRGAAAACCRFGLPVLILACAFLYARANFGPADSSHTYGTAAYSEAGSLYSYYADSKYAVLGALDDGSFWRADTSFMTTGEENGSLILGYHGTSMYNSVLNTAVIDTLRDLDSIGINAVHRLFSMDGQTALEAMANVRYFLTLPGEERTVPAGFVPREDLSGEELLVYENTQPLPFGYAADAYVSAQDFSEMSSLEKQQAMLQGAVLSGEDPEAESALRQALQTGTDITEEKVQLPGSGENTELTKKGVKVREAGGSFEVEMPFKAGCECYVYFEGLYRNKEYSFVRLDTPGLTKMITLRSTGGTYSLGRKDYLVCLGNFAEDGTQRLKVSFPEKGGYRLKGMRFYYVPVSGITERIRELSACSMENLHIEGGEVSGTIDLDKDRMLILSIPWREGWKASVDGEQTALRRVNGMYTGLLLGPGEHSIELRYISPGLTAGTVISLAGLVLFVLLLAASRRGRKKNG